MVGCPFVSTKNALKVGKSSNKIPTGLSSLIKLERAFSLIVTFLYIKFSSRGATLI